MITANQDTVFTRSETFADLFGKYQVTLDAYVRFYANALGVIYLFAKRLKLAVAKFILLYENKASWGKNTNQVIIIHPVTALDGIKPNEAHRSTNKEHI